MSTSYNIRNGRAYQAKRHTSRADLAAAAERKAAWIDRTRADLAEGRVTVADLESLMMRGKISGRDFRELVAA